jgi:hypothetical protein
MRSGLGGSGASGFTEEENITVLSLLITLHGLLGQVIAN